MSWQLGATATGPRLPDGWRFRDLSIIIASGVTADVGLIRNRAESALQPANALAVGGQKSSRGRVAGPTSLDWYGIEGDAVVGVLALATAGGGNPEDVTIAGVIVPDEHCNC